MVRSTFLIKSASGLFGIALLLTSCGEQAGQLRKVIGQGEKEKSAEAKSEDLGLTASDPNAAVTMIRIIRPYCENGVAPVVYLPTMCTGTVISDRHVLTAAHCFLSGCALDRNIEIAKVRIPSVPTANLTTFDWEDSSKVVSARNVAIGGKFAGYTEIVPGAFPQPNALASGKDLAVIDFGPGLSSVGGYPVLPYMDTNKDVYVVGLSGKLTPISYSKGPTWNTLERNVKQTRTKYLLSSTPSSTEFVNSLLLSAKNSFGAVDMGCWGDSGAPLISNGKIIGIASIGFNSEIAALGGSPQLSPGPSLGACNSTQNFTYNYILAADIDAAAAAASASTKTTFSHAFDIMNLPCSKRETIKSNTGVVLGCSVTPLQRALRYINLYTSVHVNTSDATGTKWAKVANPANAATFLGSQFANGMLDAIPAVGSGTRSATWTRTGLTKAYYAVNIYYPKHAGNANCVKVFYKTTRDASYLPLINLDQRTDASSTIAPTSYTNTNRKVTAHLPKGIWVDNNLANATGSGSLSIKISDAGCGTAAAPAGKIFADSIGLVMGSQTK